jgi:hypothetical protein
MSEVIVRDYEVDRLERAKMIVAEVRAAMRVAVPQDPVRVRELRARLDDALTDLRSPVSDVRSSP